MNNSVLFLCICACVGTLTVALPQQQQQRQRQRLPAASTTTNTPPTPLATPEFFACMQACPATSEYNPICGSDSQNYHNAGRLQCAARCGRDVAAVRMGTCLPL